MWTGLPMRSVLKYRQHWPFYAADLARPLYFRCMCLCIPLLILTDIPNAWPSLIFGKPLFLVEITNYHHLSSRHKAKYIKSPSDGNMEDHRAYFFAVTRKCLPKPRFSKILQRLPNIAGKCVGGKTGVFYTKPLQSNIQALKSSINDQLVFTSMRWRRLFENFTAWSEILVSLISINYWKSHCNKKAFKAERKAFQRMS